MYFSLEKFIFFTAFAIMNLVIKEHFYSILKYTYNSGTPNLSKEFIFHCILTTSMLLCRPRHDRHQKNPKPEIVKKFQTHLSGMCSTNIIAATSTAFMRYLHRKQHRDSIENIFLVIQHCGCARIFSK